MVTWAKVDVQNDQKQLQDITVMLSKTFQIGAILTQNQL